MTAGEIERVLDDVNFNLEDKQIFIDFVKAIKQNPKLKISEFLDMITRRYIRKSLIERELVCLPSDFLKLEKDRIHTKKAEGYIKDRLRTRVQSIRV